MRVARCFQMQSNLEDRRWNRNHGSKITTMCDNAAPTVLACQSHRARVIVILIVCNVQCSTRLARHYNHVTQWTALKREMVNHLDVCPTEKKGKRFWRRLTRSLVGSREFAQSSGRGFEIRKLSFRVSTLFHPMNSTPSPFNWPLSLKWLSSWESDTDRDDYNDEDKDDDNDDDMALKVSFSGKSWRGNKVTFPLVYILHVFVVHESWIMRLT